MITIIYRRVQRSSLVLPPMMQQILGENSRCCRRRLCVWLAAPHISDGRVLCTWCARLFPWPLSRLRYQPGGDTRRPQPSDLATPSPTLRVQLSVLNRLQRNTKKLHDVGRLKPLDSGAAANVCLWSINNFFFSPQEDKKSLWRESIVTVAVKNASKGWELLKGGFLSWLSTL